MARAAVTRVHVIGAGLAGLSAAMALAEAGRTVTVYEAGPAAGGRCRSYFDRGLGMRIDNGNHLLLSGNHATMAFLDRIGARASMAGPGVPLFPFMDAATGARWTVRPSPGRIPWWIFRHDRRVPGTHLRDYLQLLALRKAGAEATVTEVLDRDGALYRRLLEPLAVAALNTRPEAGLARLMGAVVSETLLRGGQACIPLYPREGLSESFIDPAVSWLEAHGGRLLTGRRIAGIGIEDNRVVGLDTPEGKVAVAPDEAVVLAVPASVAAGLLPWLEAPDAFEAILNIHFRVAAEPKGVLRQTGFLSVIGGTAEWIFVKNGIVSVTVSAANRIVDLSAEEIAARVWPDVRAALDLPEPMPPVRVVKERRATFAATAAQEARRPGQRTHVRNLALAGDWTATGLPATIEGAIRAGRVAAECVLLA
ncbi:hydroxysqualene dehydroxylase HpnE [Limobrevibacterium gyesilva]|uniref:Hydroxysqualene dehydroxylase HpnE n=1 Tax=Limobrevibacterium gyesilva TaxID=2991712 RepID=A0AA41YQM2_9PROT|nr:hydroxysqualene dehydroxylase HpnE [Limobrevibacterium gyesilva]